MNASPWQMLIAFTAGLGAGPFLLYFFERAILKWFMRYRGRAWMRHQMGKEIESKLDELENEP